MKDLDKIGEHPSVGEELLQGVSEFELKCNAVEESVEDGYFTLDEALSSFGVKESEYNEYLEAE